MQKRPAKVLAEMRRKRGYLLSYHRLMAADPELLAAYDAFYKRLIAAAPLQDVSSSFAMEQIKLTTALPI